MSRIRKSPRSYGGQLIGRTRLAGVWSDQFVPLQTGYSTCIDSTHPGPPYRSGGNLFIERKSVDYRYSVHNYASQSALLAPAMDTVCYCPAYIPVPAPSWRDPSQWGAIGWNRTVPTAPVLSLGNFIVELKDIPHMLAQTRDLAKSLGKDGFRNPGGHYLNYQFGWKLFVQDLMNILDVQQALDKKIRQLRRDNGKPVRRACSLGVEDTQSHISTTLRNTSILGPSVASNVRLTKESVDTVTLRYRRNLWYAARYRYWIPELANPRSDLRPLKAKLLGLVPDPGNVYNAIPWTWLIDWFTNVGSVLENVANNMEFHVIADYAYVMAHESYEYTRRANGWYAMGSFVSSPTTTVNLWASTVTRYEWKTRTGANPYGFGVSDSSLTGYQWSILAALGLSRLR